MDEDEYICRKKNVKIMHQHGEEKPLVSTTIQLDIMKDFSKVVNNMMTDEMLISKGISILSYRDIFNDSVG